MQLIIGNKNYSSWSLRPWLAMKVAGIEFEEKMVPLDFVKNNTHLLEFSPAKKVPVLIDGDLHIWESLAICEYMAEGFPDKRLWPVERSARAHARVISSEMHAGFSDLRNRLHMNIRRKREALDYSKAVARDIARIDDIWRNCLENKSIEGPYLFGNFTIADAMFAPVVSRFHTYKVKVSETSQNYMDVIRALPAMREWEKAAKQEEWVIEQDEN